MFTKLETFFAVALVFLTTDNALLTAYLVDPNIDLIYGGLVCQTIFFAVITIAVIYFVRVKNKRIIVE